MMIILDDLPRDGNGYTLCIKCKIRFRSCRCNYDYWSVESLEDMPIFLATPELFGQDS